MSVSLMIKDSGPYEISWHPDMNIQDAMEEAYNSSSFPTFSLQYYGNELGYMVIMINWCSNQSNYYWILYLNGEYLQTGIDSTILNDGDVVDFAYEPFNADKHTSDLHKAVHAHFSR